MPTTNYSHVSRVFDNTLWRSIFHRHKTRQLFRLIRFICIYSNDFFLLKWRQLRGQPPKRPNSLEVKSLLTRHSLTPLGWCARSKVSRPGHLPPEGPAGDSYLSWRCRSWPLHTLGQTGSRYKEANMKWVMQSLHVLVRASLNLIPLNLSVKWYLQHYKDNPWKACTGTFKTAWSLPLSARTK